MPSEKTITRLKQIPGPDNQSLDSPEKLDQFEKTIAAFLSDGQESVVDLTTALKPPADADTDDAKARFVLHALAVRVSSGDEDQRKQYAQALASSLSNDLPEGASQFVVRELQVCGRGEVAPVLGKLLTHENRELADSAAQALVAIGDGAADQLRAALPKSKGVNRLIVIQNLGVLGDKQSAATIRESLRDEDQDTRLAACHALANIGDAGSADGLVQVAKKETGFARAQAVDACLVLAEKLEASGDGKAAEKIRAAVQ